MIDKKQAMRMVSELAGLKRWKNTKAGFGALVCEDEPYSWYFQIPSNISVYDPEDERLLKAYVSGTIDKETGKIELLILMWENPWNPGNRNHGYNEEDIPKRYRKYPLWVPWVNPSVYKFDKLEKALIFLKWRTM